MLTAAKSSPGVAVSILGLTLGYFIAARLSRHYVVLDNHIGFAWPARPCLCKSVDERRREVGP